MSSRPLASFVLVLSLMTGCVGIGGEKIPVLHDPIESAAGSGEGTVAVARTARDLREETSRIGRTTITVFAITTGNVTTQSPVTHEIVDAVAAALSHAGYEVRLFESDVALDSPAAAVSVEIHDFWFKNYNWFWPIVPTWGDLAVALRVTGDSGQSLYERTFEGDGSSVCLLGNCAFKAAVRRATNEVLEQIDAAVREPAFREALRLDLENPESQESTGNGLR